MGAKEPKSLFIFRIKTPLKNFEKRLVINCIFEIKLWKIVHCATHARNKIMTEIAKKKKIILSYYDVSKSSNDRNPSYKKKSIFAIFSDIFAS